MNGDDPADSLQKCVYFYVITLTTVGLGDISMTEAKPLDVLGRVLFHFCVGLTLVTSVFNALRAVIAAVAHAKDEAKRQSSPKYLQLVPLARGAGEDESP